MAALFKNLDTVPHHSYDFLWADYVELLCLCSKNACVSSGNLHALMQESRDTQEEDEESCSPELEPEELDDQIARRWDDIHRRLQARSVSWPEWPFHLERAVLTSTFDNNKPMHRLYVALLIASSLRLCEKKRCNEVTSAFEEISYDWLKSSLSNHWEVRPFGAHQTLPNAYEGTLREKFERLAKDIQATPIKPSDAYDARDTGDGGIDLVAWMRTGDRRGNIPVIFGQCACSPTDWESKQLSVSGPSVEAHIAPQHPGAAYCFVPHDLQLDNTKWRRGSHVLRTVLVDRARILHLFRQNSEIPALANWPFVDEPIKQQIALAT
jgi:hypothetical protein